VPTLESALGAAERTTIVPAVRAAQFTAICETQCPTIGATIRTAFKTAQWSAVCATEHAANESTLETAL
jgi:hypothetical protein